MIKAPDILVTGAAGFVGGWIANALAKDGRVFGVTRRSERLSGAIRTVVADLVQPLPRLESVHRPVVVHCGALMGTDDARSLYDANVTATFNALQWAVEHEARSFIYMSSGGVYPYARGHWHREDETVAPIGFYGHSKRCGEQLVEAFARTRGLPAASLRLFFPYGPGQTRGIMPFIATAVRTGAALTIKAGGEPTMNPVHVADLLDAVRCLIGRLDTRDGHAIYNIGGAEPVSFGEAVSRFERHFGKTASITRSDQSEGDLLGDISLAHQELGWRPRHRLTPEAVLGAIGEPS